MIEQKSIKHVFKEKSVSSPGTYDFDNQQYTGWLATVFLFYNLAQMPRGYIPYNLFKNNTPTPY